MITRYTRKIIRILQKSREHIRSWILGCRKRLPWTNIIIT